MSNHEIQEKDEGIEIARQMAEEEDARAPEKPFIKCHLKIPFKV